MALRLPWSDRVAALGRQGEAATEVGLVSRKKIRNRSEIASRVLAAVLS